VTGAGAADLLPGEEIRHHTQRAYWWPIPGTDLMVSWEWEGADFVRDQITLVVQRVGEKEAADVGPG